MAKRLCPFEDNYAPPIKVHVSTIDMNKQSEKYMQTIYDKTLNMLFKASNKTSEIKQQEKVIDKSVCTECRKSIESKSNCWFCEITLCAKCTKTCDYCNNQFCSHCTVAIYKNGDSYTCLTCYK